MNSTEWTLAVLIEPGASGRAAPRSLRRAARASLPSMEAAAFSHAEADGSTGEAPAFFSHLTEADFANEDALIEAGKLYGDDADRELADLEAGRHPLQRPR
jgi:hypothetical protein